MKGNNEHEIRKQKCIGAVTYSSRAGPADATHNRKERRILSHRTDEQRRRGLGEEQQSGPRRRQAAAFKVTKKYSESASHFLLRHIPYVCSIWTQT